MEAKRLGQFEEVASLEANLVELQTEYQKVQEERAELEENYNSFKGLFHKSSPQHEIKREENQGSQNDPAEANDDMDEYDASGKNPFV